MLSNIDFYGDKTRWFIARVVDDKDPELRGRFKVSIKGIHSESQADIPISALPWAESLLPTTEGGTSGHGRIAQLLPGSLVFGVFLDGTKSQLPLILGHLNQLEKPTPPQNQQLESRGTFTTPDEIQRNGVIMSSATRAAGQNANRSSRRWAAMNFFVENGFTPIQAAGIVGNLEQESAFNPTVVSAFANESSQGIAQWNPDAGRLQQLQAFGSYSNLDWREFDTQLLFIMHEFQGSPLGPNDGASTQGRAYKEIKKASTYFGGLPPVGQESSSKNSTYIFTRRHSGGGNPPRSWIENTAHLQQREQYAHLAYTQYYSTLNAKQSAESTGGPV